MDWQAKFNYIKQMSMHFQIINKSHGLCFSSAIWTYQFQIKNETFYKSKSEDLSQGRRI